MDNFYNFKKTEGVLLIAVKLPTMGIKYVAQETGININNLYRWTSGAGHISVKNADILLNWLENRRPDALEAALILYQGGNTNGR